MAIGISIKNLLKKNGIKFDELVIGQYNPLDYDKIIIGGGHLIRPSPDVFYDKFKISGNHILNSVGIVGDPSDLYYLNNYEYISVRSSGDKEKLKGIKKDVYIVPCTTMCLEDIDNLSIEPIAPSIGIHLIPWIFKTKEEEDSFIKWANALPFNIYFLPITHYNYDINYMRYLQNKIKNSNLLPILSPLEIFTLIGKFNYFISNSLHGAIFSYIHNIPFILYNLDEKMRFFMEDRGLIEYLFNNYEMQEKFGLLIEKKPDYSKLIKQDKEKINNHIQKMLSVLKESEISTIKGKDFHHDDEKNITNNQIFFLQRQIEHLECEYNSLQNENDSLKNENYELQSENNALIQRLSDIENIGSCLKRLKWRLCRKPFFEEEPALTDRKI